MHILAKFSGDWADEMDVYGFEIFTVEAWDLFKLKLENHFKESHHFEWYFGTNEHFGWSSMKNFMRFIETREIGETERLILSTLLGTPYGHFPTLDSIGTLTELTTVEDDYDDIEEESISGEYYET